MSTIETALRHKAVLRWLGNLPPGAQDLVRFDYHRDTGIPLAEVEDVEDEYLDLDWVWRRYGHEISA